ncbi:hypothetical protein FNV43_RR01629 [Rhamnella rubrinervis]|uniref:Uncharacterized protein n=1 Tax=Rhamnella rubrinervis TaxID=2594499 RepID=A0A8K0HSP6_9ROSA|nr:hypothetical protein FNV43_RR01629 [Rhamnella rubrinervis]
MVRQRRRRRHGHNGGRPEFQKFRDGGIFPKGVAVWDPHAMMVGNVRPSMAREATAICGFSGLNVLGVAGDASGGATLFVRCWDYPRFFEAPYGFASDRAVRAVGIGDSERRALGGNEDTR